MNKSIFALLTLTLLIGCSKKETNTPNVLTSTEPIRLTCNLVDTYHLNGPNFSPNKQDSTEKSVKSIVITYEPQTITEQFVSILDKSGKLTKTGIEEERKVWVVNVNNNIKISQKQSDISIEGQKDYSERESVSLDDTSITALSTFETKYYTDNKMKRLQDYKVFINRVSGEVNIVDVDTSDIGGVKNSTYIESKGLCKKSEQKF